MAQLVDMTYNHDLFHSSLQRFLIFIRESLGGRFFIYSMKAYKIAILKSLDMSMILLYYPFLLFLKCIVFWMQLTE